MMGNYHVRFLGGSGLVTAPGYPVARNLIKPLHIEYYIGDRIRRT
jgi:hypothetical protein